MASQDAIKQAQLLLVELSNKQAFLDILKSANKIDGLDIRVSIQKITTVFLNTEDDGTYWQLIEILSNDTRKDIDRLTMKINELLKNDEFENYLSK
jgi:hypothetical protein